jgi:hypothetical protein
LTLTVAVLLARFGSGASALVAAFSVSTVPFAAVTFTVSLTVHVVFGAMALLRFHIWRALAIEQGIERRSK